MVTGGLWRNFIGGPEERSCLGGGNVESAGGHFLMVFSFLAECGCALVGSLGVCCEHRLRRVFYGAGVGVPRFCAYRLAVNSCRAITLS